MQGPPDAGAADPGDGLCRFGHTGHQQLEQILQHQVDQGLVADICGRERTRSVSARPNNEQSCVNARRLTRVYEAVDVLHRQLAAQADGVLEVGGRHVPVRVVAVATLQPQ